VYGYAPSVNALTIDVVLSAWKGRQDAVKSAHFEWQDDRFALGGSVPGSEAGDDANVQRQVSFSMMNQMYRYAISGPQWVMREKRYAPLDSLTVCNGQETRIYFSGDENGDTNTFHQFGVIHGDDYEGVLGNLSLCAILLTYRALDPTLVGFNSREYRIEPGVTMVQGHKCLRLANTTSEVDETHYWVDPARDCLVLRAERWVLGDLYYRATIDYERNVGRHWAPKAWETLSFHQQTGEVVERSRARVTRHELNPNVATDDFDFEFPVGTMVRNLKTKETYIVREDDNRLVTRAEMEASASYEKLRSTETGEAVGKRHNSSWIYVAAAITAFVMAAILMTIVWRGKAA
jgi:hypothetical protein